MPGTRRVIRQSKGEIVPIEYAGKWLAWSSDGLRIVAVGDSFEGVEQAAMNAGFAPEAIAIDRAPTDRQRTTGTAM